MKSIIAILAFLGLSAVALAGTTDACCYYQSDYVPPNVKTDVKETDKGVQINITSDDPRVAKEIQDRNRHDRNSATAQPNNNPNWYNDGCPNMDYMNHNRKWRNRSFYNGGMWPY